MKVTPKGLDPREDKLVTAIDAEPGLTATELGVATGMSSAAASSVLARLRDEGRVARDRGGWFPRDVSAVLAAIPGEPGLTATEIIAATRLAPRYVHYAMVRLHQERKIDGRLGSRTKPTRWYVVEPSQQAPGQ